MKITTFSIFIICYFIFHFFHNVPGDNPSLNNIYRSIYSGYMKSQNNLSIKEKFNLSCKFKSMNRKLKKKDKLKILNVINKS